ncbi:DUF4247 domain-containing protein [Nocardia sp. NPDC058518]|uniref:DUF4247 domain-containing protein n=1 Tax=Nocardia sp. NPDC058518 TaxID=3346534 RepID=UPI003658DE97
MALLLVLVTGVVVSWVLADEDPSEFVSENYQRAKQFDQANDGVAYLTAGAPAVVAAAIAKKTDPRDRRNTGDNHYLRFPPRYFIAVSPHAGGSLVLVDSYSNGNRRHHGHISGYGWTSGSAAGDYRGGGSDSGGK